MTSYPLYAHFIFAFFSTLGFCFLFHVPKKHLISSAFIGGCGWTLFKYLVMNGESNVISCFLGSCLVALLAEIFSRAGKDATTLFIIPGILPLVPGAGMYNTMQYVLENDLEGAAAVGSETLFMAGSIALALLIIASLTRITVAIKRQLQQYIKKLL
ncbi:threonine/serine exporter family protein [Anaerovorax odorimutans]|uniref:threonine/serine exporter family protein n=1 Tax=Anaerovorax odorimutans TaxID=109327 RepID=UPI0004120BCE|nr:threonine/serine exporter family protein [Anaerovorax odorimutans]